jgi:hypothetical protein
MMGWTLVHESCSYERLAPVEEIIALATCDYRIDKVHKLYSCTTVSQTLNSKRRDYTYDELLQAVSEEGFKIPILLSLVEAPDRPPTWFLENGHHRVAVAIDLGMTHIPITTDAELGWSSDNDDHYGGW